MKEISKLKKCRKDAGLTLNELSKLVKIPAQTISKYENGNTTNIPYERLEILASFFGKNPAYFFDWDEVNRLDPFESLKKVLSKMKKDSGGIKFSELPEPLQVQAEIASRSAVRDYFDTFLESE